MDGTLGVVEDTQGLMMEQLDQECDNFKNKMEEMQQLPLSITRTSNPY
jgi:hypothetical protein